MSENNSLNRGRMGSEESNSLNGNGNRALIEAIKESTNAIKEAAASMNIATASMNNATSAMNNAVKCMNENNQILKDSILNQNKLLESLLNHLDKKQLK